MLDVRVNLKASQQLLSKQLIICRGFYNKKKLLEGQKGLGLLFYATFVLL